MNTIIGNLCAEPTLRYTQNGTAVSNIRLAQNFAKRPDGSQPDAVFHSITVWGDTAENIADLPKGARVIALCTRFEVQRYTDRQGQPQVNVVWHSNEVGASARWNPVYSDHAPRGQQSLNFEDTLPLEDEELADAPF